MAGAGTLVLASCATQSPVVPSLASQSGPPAMAGQIVWHDLVTPDPAGARAFYSGLLGWSFEDNGAYSVIRGTDGIIGGMADGRKLGARPQSALWLTSIAVKDLDSTVRELRSAGATIRHEPTEVPNRGRLSLVEDPQQALFQLVEPGPAARRPSPGTWIWHELLTSDPKAAARWYAQLEGIDSRAAGTRDRQELLTAGRRAATISKNPFGDTRNTWVPVLAVADLSGKLAKVPSLGGRVVLSPTPAVGGGSVALILDPSGAPLILQQQKGGNS